MDHKLVEHPKGKADPNLSDLIALVISVAFEYPLGEKGVQESGKLFQEELNKSAVGSGQVSSWASAKSKQPFLARAGGEAAKAEAEGVEKEQSWWFQEKKGSVFPVKKKLVKTMMVEYIAKSFSIKMGGSSNTSPSKSSKPSIFPHP
ncbi:hypothetical protein V6N12_040909 [Hibiscus sabdariffa]|uniref:Uncharacterized protein n=1 Tax=Hibiscus sabdariffa TaxID=183260 RepID=A0ABR2E724_9ROSI